MQCDFHLEFLCKRSCLFCPFASKHCMQTSCLTRPQNVKSYCFFLVALYRNVYSHWIFSVCKLVVLLLKVHLYLNIVTSKKTLLFRNCRKAGQRFCLQNVCPSFLQALQLFLNPIRMFNFEEVFSQIALLIQNFLSS